MHTGEAPYLCSICAKAFKRKEALEHHSVVHKKDLPKVKRKYLALQPVLTIRGMSIQGFDESRTKNNKQGKTTCLA